MPTIGFGNYGGTGAGAAGGVIGGGSLGAPGQGSGRVRRQANIAQVSTPNATDLATSQALANQLKTTVNQILTALQAAGVTL